ncbi:MAG: protein kinase [Anaerolineae bacterium]|nr:protein kinase [Anaerolineae bacterium]
MGDVFRGVDNQTRTPVAIKLLKPELATQDMVQRFMREGETLRQLNHPNIVKLLDAVNDHGMYYLIMELVEGGSLDDILKRTPVLPVNEVLNIALDLADALTRAHRLNIIHRDIKPANVLLAKDGMLRLTDFGIARVIGSSITEVGSVLGTVAYIAPEVLQGQPADARSDIWSMGLMLFEMLIGEHPFKSYQQSGGLLYAIINATLPDLETLRPDVPDALVDVINRMLAKDPAERIPRMRLVGAELEAILNNDRDTAAFATEATQLVVKIAPGSRFETPHATPSSAIRHNLPLQTTPFVGREAELSELENILRDQSVRLLTIVGPGGMGKTRLSLEVAGSFLKPAHAQPLFEQGIYFIDLAPVNSPEHIVGAAAEAVGYAFQQDGRDPTQQLLDFLHGKNMLLIMDNFEHVIAGRMLVQDILQFASSVKILVTSREKLNLNAETVFVLSGMGFPTWETPADALEYGAVKLFVQSAQRVRRDFQLATDDLPYVARICRLVQGTPLGILLAAAWLEVLTPREIVDEISRSFDFLETEMHDLPERQRSLRAVFEYSWNLLAEAERGLFAQFSIFRGGFTRDAALRITGTNLRALTLMVNKSLLRRDNESGRYDIHELLRQYAEEKLAQSADASAAHAAHSRYYLELLVQLTPKLKGYGQLEALNLIDTDFENVRVAWTWAVEQSDAALVEPAIEGLYLYLWFRNRVMDGEQLFGAARRVWQTAGDDPSLLAGKLLVRYPQGDELARFRTGLAIAERHGDAAEVAFCRRLVGHWLSHTEYNQDEGIPVLEASLRGYRALGNKFCAAQVLDDLGWSHMLMLDRVGQEPIVRESLDLRREIGDKIGIANSLRNMGGAHGGFFDASDRAYTFWQEAKGIAYEMNDRLGVAWNASLQSANLIFKAEYDRADALIDEGLPHAADINDPVVKGFLLLQRGIIRALRDEDYVGAKRFIDEGFPSGSPPDFRVTFGLFARSVVACGLRDFEILIPMLGFATVMTPFFRDEFFTPMLLPCRLVQLFDRGVYARVIELMHGFFSSELTFAGYPITLAWAKHWALLNRLRAQAEAEIGADAAQAAETEGAQLQPADLVREARTFWRSIDTTPS